MERITNGHTYQIQWCDGTTSEQEEAHLFGKFSQVGSPAVGHYVLALDSNEMIYRPAVVKNISFDSKTATVQFHRTRMDGQSGTPRYFFPTLTVHF